MKRRIRKIFGNYEEVDTGRSLFGFKAGDVITREGNVDCCWNKKRVKVCGVGQGNLLWGKIEGEEWARFTNCPDGLILLERRGYTFKVGDRVRVDDFEGEIVDLNPDKNEKRYLIHFDSGGSNWFAKDEIIKDSTNQSRRKKESFVIPVRQPKTMPALPGKRYARQNAISPPFHLDRKKSSAAAKKPAKRLKKKELASKVESAKNKQQQMEVQMEMPEWLKEVLIALKAKIAHLFILHGNIYDLQKNLRGAFLGLMAYLSEVFVQRRIVFYSLSAGLQFDSEKTEKWFRGKFQAAGAQPTGSGSAIDAARQSREQAAPGQISDIVGQTPNQVLAAMERLLVKKQRNEIDDRIVFIIDFCHNIAPAKTNTPAETAVVETLERWARNKDIGEAGNVVLLMTTSFAGVASSLRTSQSGAVSVRIPKPDVAMRETNWQEALKYGQPELADGLDALILARITNGLSLRQINAMAARAAAESKPLDMEFCKRVKRQILHEEFGNRVEIKVPQFGFAYFGGKEKLKQYLLEVRDNIVRGMLRRVPMGMLAAGPPGTGKTFLFECWAYECGFNFVKISNPRSKWVGESEEFMIGILSALDDLEPVIVVEDEADQSETPRDTPNGDSGVSSRLRQMKFEFCGEPKRRGRVIWVRISNRDDLIDTAYLRKGRTDDNIPFVFPDEHEYADIFRVMFLRYKIPTEISDFTPFAKLVAKKIYCTGADVEWMVLEADKMAGREKKDSVCAGNLRQAIADWEMDLNPDDVDRQIILAIQGSSLYLRPDNWEQMSIDAETRIRQRAGLMIPPTPPVVHPDMARRAHEN